MVRKKIPEESLRVTIEEWTQTTVCVEDSFASQDPYLICVLSENTYKKGSNKSISLVKRNSLSLYLKRLANLTKTAATPARGHGRRTPLNGAGYATHA